MTGSSSNDLQRTAQTRTPRGGGGNAGLGIPEWELDWSGWFGTDRMTCFPRNDEDIALRAERLTASP